MDPADDAVTGPTVSLERFADGRMLQSADAKAGVVA
jgi:hypothetical protein